jgi:hypothetical protein
MPRSSTHFQLKPFAFVLMPFAPEFDDVYQLAIKAACRRVGVDVERVDEQVFDATILQRVYSQISRADIVIAEMSGRNANVYYEVGYAHALGKRVILLTREVDDIPFDLKHFPHVVYHGRIADLKAELARRVKHVLDAPPHAENPLLRRVYISVDGLSLERAPEIVERVSEASVGVELDVDIIYPADSGGPLECYIALVTPALFGSAFVGRPEPDRNLPPYTTTVELGDQNLHYAPDMMVLFPGVVREVRFTPVMNRPLKHSRRRHAMAVRIYSRYGAVEWQFSIRVVVGGMTA